MKKVLILTTSTGQGHNQAANSLAEEFKNKGYEIIKHDFLAKSSKFLNDIIVKGYELSAAKLPKTYGLFYKLTDTNTTNKLLSILFLFPKLKIRKLINEIKPDVIIGTHPFCCGIIGNLKKEGLNVPFISVVTDFKAHYTYINKYVDAYITGSNYTKQSLIARNIPSDKIFPLGIPISKKFYTEITEASTLRNDDYFNLLLMSGSFGLSTIFTVLKQLLSNKNKLRITVVCGKNKKLKENLTKYCSEHKFKNKKIHIIGFTNDISYLMDYSDVLISKPGGLTVTESIVKNIPLIIPFGIPGQEYENIDFLTTEGYSIYVKDLNNLNSIVDDLIDNPELLIKMKTKLIDLSDKYSLDKIVDVADSIQNKKVL